MKELDLQDVACRLQGLSFALDGMVDGIEPYVVDMPLEIKQGYTFASNIIASLITDINKEYDRLEKEFIAKHIKEVDKDKREVA